MPEPVKSIVVGYDGSDAGERALERAAELAEAMSARLVVVSVGGYPPVPVTAFEPATGLIPPGPAVTAGGMETMPPPEAGAPAPEAEELARQQLERARSTLAGHRIETEYVVELGEPAERLLEVTESRGADLLVVGHREHGFFDRLLRQPVDETLARRSKRDVLLVH
jgi:nucleotide-binding universal stress UspA family protein